MSARRSLEELPLEASKPQLAYETELGRMWEGDALDVMKAMRDDTINLVLTSPPFALTREKAYGNEPEESYVKWFIPFAEQFKRILKDDGSVVIDLGGAWRKGSPSKSLYQYRLLIALADEVGLHLCQEFYWWNTSKLPGPAQWVNIERRRVKDAVNCIWWLSPDPAKAKANNRNVLKPYTPSMRKLVERGTYNEGTRPSEHRISKTWAEDRGGAIAPNVIEVNDATVAAPIEFDEDGNPIVNLREHDSMIAVGNTTSGDAYHVFARDNDLRRHPARFPHQVPEFFIRFLTDKGDRVYDPFGGSNVTGMVAEDLKRKWVVSELDWEYIATSMGRFSKDSLTINDEHMQSLAEVARWPLFKQQIDEAKLL